MDSITLTCLICDRIFSTNNYLYAHMKKHLSPETKYLFSEKDIDEINRIYTYVSAARNADYIKHKTKNVCNICDKKMYNKQLLICHKKMHLVPEHMHRFTEAEIKEILDTHKYRSDLKKGYYKKHFDKLDEPDEPAAAAAQPSQSELFALSILPKLPPKDSLPVPELIPIPKMHLPVPELIPIEF
uniref:C2H2-type domain-containing protein n=1 Tax=viral metagenome TaxID=1070528 RepID=A0A6C0HXB5_9ZZZZ